MPVQRLFTLGICGLGVNIMCEFRIMHPVWEPRFFQEVKWPWVITGSLISLATLPHAKAHVTHFPITVRDIRTALGTSRWQRSLWDSHEIRQRCQNSLGFPVLIPPLPGCGHSIRNRTVNRRRRRRAWRSLPETSVAAGTEALWVDLGDGIHVSNVTSKWRLVYQLCCTYRPTLLG
jgi:hypothetical protein